MLVIITKGLKLDEGEECCNNVNLAETQTLFGNVVNQFKTLIEISEAMNAVVAKLIQIIVLVDGLGLVGVLNHTLNGNYSATCVYMFRLVKDGLAIYGIWN